MAQATDDPADPDQTEIVNLAAVEHAKDPQGDQNVLRLDLNLCKVKKNMCLCNIIMYTCMCRWFLYGWVFVYICATSRMIL